MKLTEKDLRKLIKEELEGSEDTRDAIESNLHDEIIVRYFEGLEKGELTEEQIDSEIQQMDEGKVSSLIPRLAGFMFKNRMVAKLMGKISENPRFTAQLAALIIKKMGLDPADVLLPAFLAKARGAQDDTKTGFEDDETPSEKVAESGNLANVTEEIINKVVENLFDSSQNK
jgi:hypothetical protein